MEEEGTRALQTIVLKNLTLNIPYYIRIWGKSSGAVGYGALIMDYPNTAEWYISGSLTAGHSPLVNKKGFTTDSTANLVPGQAGKDRPQAASPSFQ